MSEQGLLIEVDALRRQLSNPQWRVFDVRHNLFDAQAGRQAYLAGHVPGAFFLHQDTDLAGPMTGSNGRHPLPDRGTLAAVLQRCGLGPGHQAVVYDQGNSALAVRAWWLLRWLGHSSVSILNGGWQAWQQAGAPVQTEDNPVPQDGPRRVSAPSAMPVVEAGTILANLDCASQYLLDARDAPRYHGLEEPLDPVAGHIPRARNRPLGENLQADGRFKPAARLREEFTALLGQHPPEQVVHYCGSGITACHNLFAMELAGLRGSALYAGSWSEWCSDPQRPVARNTTVEDK